MDIRENKTKKNQNLIINQKKEVTELLKNQVTKFLKNSTF